MVLLAVLVALGIACAMCFSRAVLGPTAPDRVVAVDAFTAILVACFVLLGVYYRAPFYLDVALVYAIMAFIGTLAVAKYLEGRGLES